MPLHLNRARLNTPTLIQLNQDGDLPTEVLVIPIGSYKTYIGDFDFTDAVFAEMAANFKRGVPNAVPINFNHKKGEAAGWVTEVAHKAGEGLFATVEWTKKGKEALSEKIYRFLSAEFNLDYEDSTFGNLHGAVLGGIGLTNYPMLQNIPALLSQDAGVIKDNDNHPITILFSQEGAFMNLDEIRQKSAADLSPEERTFLQEHSADLNDDERTRFEIKADDQSGDDSQDGDQEDGQGDGDNAGDGNQGGDGDDEGDNADQSTQLSQNKGQMIQMSAAEVRALRSQADQGSKAFMELSQMRLEREVVEPMLFSQANQKGAFLPKSTDALKQFVFSLSDEQRKQFSSLVKELPTDNAHLLSEIGDGNDNNTATDGKLVELAQAKVEAAAKENKTLTFSQALQEVSIEHKDLVDNEYNYEGAE